MAEVIARPQYINTDAAAILGRLLGDYDYGDGRKEKDPAYMTFFAREANLPLKSHGLWWLSQFRRWGMVDGSVDYRRVVDQVHRPDLYRQAAGDLGLTVSAADEKPETLFDGVVFDPKAPEAYAKQFPVNNLIA
jgi:nitrate/nitrite transport system substrate-binding protein